MIAATILWNQFVDCGLMFSIPKTCQVLWLPDLVREHPGIAWLTLLRPVSVGKTDQILSDTPMRPSAADDLKLSARLWKEMEE